MRRLLAVSWEMPPMYGPRAAQVSRVVAQLPTLGWRPSVVCLAPRRGGPHWPAGAAADPPDGVDYVRVASPEEWWTVRALRRAAPALRERPDASRTWVPRATRAALDIARSERGVAGLITFAQPWSDHLVGLRVQRATGLPWVAHFSDPWASSPYATERQRSIWRPMEAQVVRAATAVVFVTEETADLTMSAYPGEWRRKVAIVPHGFDRADAATPAPAGRRSRMRFVYTGRFYSGVRTPVPLLRALAVLQREMPLRDTIEVAFIGPHVEEFRAAAAAAGVESFVTFHDRVAAREAARAAADADVLLVIDAASGAPSVFLPSKLIDYLPFRKPILGITPPEGASARLLGRLGFEVAAPEDVDGIASRVRTLVERWRAGALEVAPEFDRVAAEFDVRCTARQLHDVMTRAFA